MSWSFSFQSPPAGNVGYTASESPRPKCDKPECDDQRGTRLTSPAIELARAAANGDVQATARLLREVGPRVMATVRAVLGGGHPDIDDVAQQSLILLVQSLPNFRGECEPVGYACRIAVRAAVTARRRVRLNALRNEPSNDDSPAPSSGPLPDEIAASARRTLIVRELLETIPEEQAECLALRVVLGWSLDEIATACNIPMNTVRSRVRLAKEALRRRIEEDPRLLAELEGTQ